MVRELGQRVAIFDAPLAGQNLSLAPQKQSTEHGERGARDDEGQG